MSNLTEAAAALRDAIAAYEVNDIDFSGSDIAATQDDPYIAYNYDLHLAGRRVGNLTVALPAFERDASGVPLWHAMCDCGKTCTITDTEVRGDPNQGLSCGCKPRDLKQRPLYNIWRGMRNRCYYPSNPAYRDYGGRGIGICAEWVDAGGYFRFEAWAESHGYQHGLSIDRIDNDGDYEPSNCRWADAEQQANNRRNNTLLTLGGLTLTLSEWTQVAAVNANTLAHRLARGWSPIDALTVPSGGERRATA